MVRLDNAELPVGLRDIPFRDYSGVQPDKIAADIAFHVEDIAFHVEAELSPPPPRSAAPSPASRRLARRRPTRRRLWYYAILLLLLGLASLIFFDLVQLQMPATPPIAREEPSLEDTTQSILPIVTTAIIFIASVSVGLVLFFRRRRRLLASARARREHRHEGEESEPGPEGVLFVSYSRDDRPKVNVIVNKLERSGLKTWLDTRREADAQRFARSIVQAIRSSKACAFMCSSTAYGSDHVVRELYLADKYRKPMIPVEMETCTLSEDFEYFFSGLEFIPYKPIDRCVQVIIHRLQSAQVPKNI